MTTLHGRESTATFAARSHELENLTVASAWAASPLGDPAVEDGYLSDMADFENDLADFENGLANFETELAGCEADSADFDADRPIPDAKPRSFGKTALIVAAAIAAIGACAALGVTLVSGNGSNQPKPAVVISGSGVISSTSQAPAPVPSADVPAPTSVVSPPASGQPEAGGGGGTTSRPGVNGGGGTIPTLASGGGATPTYPRVPPAGTPSAPSATVVPQPAPLPQTRGAGPGGRNQGGRNQGGGNQGGGNQGAGNQGGGNQGNPGNGHPMPAGGGLVAPPDCIPCQLLNPQHH
jgi:hypothetical protein